MAKKRATTPAAAPARADLTINLNPAPESAQAIVLRTEAGALAIRNRDDHTAALEWFRGAKELRRKVATHWAQIKRSVDDLKRNILALERRDLEPIDDALTTATRVIQDYEADERRRAQDAQDRIRRQKVAEEEEKQRLEAKRLEDAALELEASTDALSDREQIYVARRLDGDTGYNAAKAAGYKDPFKQTARLEREAKIVQAILAGRNARALKAQAAAVKEEPIVTSVPEVKPELGHTNGIRRTTHYSAELLSVRDLVFGILERHLDGIEGQPSVLLLDDLLQVLTPSQTALNTQARQHREDFEKIYRGVRLVVKHSLAG